MEDNTWNRELKQGWFKMNTGVAAINSFCWGVGVIIRDPEGAVLAAETTHIQCGNDSSVAEAMGIRFGIRLAIDLLFLQLEIESDSLEVISCIHKGAKDPSPPISLIARDCISLSGQLHGARFIHTRRQGNIAAHQLAKFACSQSADLVWIEEVPSCISSSILADVLAFSNQ
ncbi:Ribonuclease H-like superfamily [Sesbania bispinosa]|nr:Ribonuclease H-like superfamily [Sesbania bispinosa]